MTLLGGAQLPKRGLGFEPGQLTSRALVFNHYSILAFITTGRSRNYHFYFISQK